MEWRENWRPSSSILPFRCANTEAWNHMGCHMIRIRILYSLFWGFAGGSDDKESAWNAGDTDLIPGWGRCPREGDGNLLQYSFLENPMIRGARQATVYGVAKAWHNWVTDTHTHTVLIFSLSSEYFPLCHQNTLPTKLDHSNVAICKM